MMARLLQLNERIKRTVMTLAVLALLLVGGGVMMGRYQAQAATAPEIITYQGKILEGGVAVTTTKAMAFLLYNSLTGGNLLYTAGGTLVSTSTINVTPNSGLFTVNLGDGAATNVLNPEIFQNNANVYLEVIVAGEKLSPRKQVVAVPYAFNAKYLDGVGATSTASTSAYIPIADNLGNFNFNAVTTTNIYASGAVTSTGNLSVVGNSYLSTVVSGTWQGSAITDAYISSAANWNSAYNIISASSSNWQWAFETVTSSYTNWNAAYSWGDHALAGYLTSYTEADSIWLAASSSYVRWDAASTTLWNTAYSWGDHALAGYITDGNTGWDNFYGFITSSSAETLTNKSGAISMWTNDVGYVTSSVVASSTYWDQAYNWGNHALAGYLTTTTGNWQGTWQNYNNTDFLSSSTIYVSSESDPIWAAASTSLTISNFASANISQWTNDAGYVTSSQIAGYETDPIWTAASSSYLTTTTAAATYEPIITTLPVSKGGTGQTSFTSGYILFGSSTSPIATSSNLYWDDATGRFGIGTTTPSYSLDIQGATGDLFRVGTSTNPNLVLINNSGQVGIGTTTFDSQLSNAVLVANGSIFASEVVYTRGFYDKDYSNNSSITFNNGGNFYMTLGSQQYIFGDTGGVGGQRILHINNLNNDIDFQVDGDNNEGLIFTDASLDRVGIGTTSMSSYLLTVNGDVNMVSSTGGTSALRINGSDVSQYFITSAGNSGELWQSDGSGAGQWANTSTLGITAALSGGSTGYLPYWTSASELSYANTTTGGLYWDQTNGRLGVGTTSPSAALEVQSSSYPPGRIVRVRTETNADTSPWGILNLTAQTSADMIDTFGGGLDFSIQDSAGTNNTIATVGSRRYGADNSGTLEFYTANAGTRSQVMTILPSGYVGIGTTTPSAPFTVYSTNAPPARVIRESAAANSAQVALELSKKLSSGSISDGFGPVVNFFGIAADGTSNLYGGMGAARDGADTKGRLVFTTSQDGVNTAERMTILNTGYVGIGTTSPASALHLYDSTSLAWTAGGTSKGAVTVGIPGSGSSLWVNTPSLNTTYNSGFGVSGSYSGGLSTVILGGYGVLSAGGYSSDMILRVTSEGATKDAVYIDGSTQYVGIGTNSPGAALDVQNASYPVSRSTRVTSDTNSYRGAAQVVNKSTGTISDGFGVAFDFAVQDTSLSSPSNIASIIAKRSGGNTTGDIYLVPLSGGTGQTSAFVVKSTGYVGIGTTTPAYKLQVYVDSSNEGHVAADGSWANSSDVRLKKNVSTITNALSLVSSIRPVYYDSVSKPTEQPLNSNLGFIAQELEEVLPQVVDTNSLSGIKSISYAKLTPLLVAAIQEQQVQITALTIGLGATNTSTGQQLSVVPTVFNDKIVFKNHVVFDEDSVGRAKIMAGATSTYVGFDNAYDGLPVITATPLDFVSGTYRVVSTNTVGFAVEIEMPQAGEVNFNWHAFGANRLMSHSSDGTKSEVYIVINSDGTMTVPGEDNPPAGEQIAGDTGGGGGIIPDVSADNSSSTISDAGSTTSTSSGDTASTTPETPPTGDSGALTPPDNSGDVVPPPEPPSETPPPGNPVVENPILESPPAEEPAAEEASAENPPADNPPPSESPPAVELTSGE